MSLISYTINVDPYIYKTFVSLKLKTLFALTFRCVHVPLTSLEGSLPILSLLFFVLSRPFIFPSDMSVTLEYELRRWRNYSQSQCLAWISGVITWLERRWQDKGSDFRVFRRAAFFSFVWLSLRFGCGWRRGSVPLSDPAFDLPNLLAKFVLAVCFRVFIWDAPWGISSASLVSRSSLEASFSTNARF